jgi:hypothetical protein
MQAGKWRQHMYLIAQHASQMQCKQGSGEASHDIHATAREQQRRTDPLSVG